MKKIAIVLSVVALALIVGGALVVSNRTSAPFTFEPQTRAVLEDVKLHDTRRPVVAVTANGAVYVLAIAGDPGQLMMTMSHDGGDTFMPPQEVSPKGARISAHGENGPSLFVRAMDTYAVWQQNTGGRNDVVFAKARGMHGGFSAPLRVTDKSPTNSSFSGFSRMGVAPNGDIYVAWLDGRDKPNPPGTFSLYLAKSADGGQTFSKNIPIATAVCPCCRPSLAFGPAGEVYVAWRKVFEGDVRDIVVAVSRDAGQTFSTPVKAGDDQWVLNACPDVGPSLAIHGKRLVAAWMSEGKGGPGIRFSYSDDGGRSFSEPELISRGVVDATHPELTAGPDELLLTFQGREGRADSGWGRFRPYVVRIDKNANASQPQAAGIPQASSSYPTVASAGVGKAVLAWTENNQENNRVLLQRLRW